MATTILSLSDQCRELAVIDGIASALAVASEIYNFGSLEDGEIQRHCETTLMNLIPDLARRISKLNQSAHAAFSSGGNVVRMK